MRTTLLKAILVAASLSVVGSAAIAQRSAVDYFNRGVAEKANDDLEGAIADYNRAIELDPKYAAAYFHRGIAKQAKGDLKGAIGDINGAIERNDRDFYPRLFLWLMRSRLGEGDAANKELAAFLQKRRDPKSEEWTSKLAGHLLGNVSEADLFAAAKSSDAKKERGLFCEAWFFAGMKKLLKGDKATAADYFRKCIATERTDFVEYQLAQSELKALTK